ncbi:MAG: helix-turn-helix transcriptional regulator [Deltaproteobacteria bacterium]|nr:helix-turn-helix transcriptional regulator [Deltaproteobacteria bacterium]
MKKKSDAIKFLEHLREKYLTFGQMIESIRLADHISQAELSRKLKISRANLCDIEKNRRMVSLERAAQFAKILGYSQNQFVAVAIEDYLKKAGFKAKVILKGDLKKNYDGQNNHFDI